MRHFARGPSPAVRALVDRHHLTFAELPALGPKGLVLKGDVLAFLAKATATGGRQPVIVAPAPALAPLAPPVRVPKVAPPVHGAGEIFYTDAPASNIRQIIAQRLTESKTQIPHAYSRVDVDMAAISAWRKAAIGALRACSVPWLTVLGAAESGAKFSLNDIIIKAAGVALKAVPAINTTYSAQQQLVVVSASADIAVAVASPRGLITPIVTNSDARSVRDIAATVAVPRAICHVFPRPLE